MTSATLSRNKAGFNLFKFTVRKNIGIIILATVFMLLICPGYVFIEMSNYRAGSSFFSNPYNMKNSIIGISTVITVVVSIIAVFSCFVNFSFLYSKKSVDVYHALPITRTSLLFSRFFAAVVPLFIPIILCYGSLIGLSFFDNVVADIKSILTAFAFSAAIMLMSAAFTMIFIVCAGSVFDLIISFVGINLGAFLSVLIVFSLCDKYLIGFYGSNESFWIWHSSPFIYGVAAQYSVLYKQIGYNSLRILQTEPIVSLLMILAIAVVSVVCSVFLYNRSKSEKSGDSYAYKFIYYICSILVGFVAAYGLGMIFSVGSYGVVFWIFAVLGAVLGTVTLGGISDKGFKTVKRSVVLGVVAAGLLAVTALSLNFDITGFSKRIPETDSIKEATVNLMGDEFKVNPKKAVELHKFFVEEAGKDAEYYGQYAIINYELEGSKNLNRIYHYDENDVPDILLEIYKFDERWEELKEKLSELNYFTVDFYGKNFDDREAAGVTLSKEQAQLLIDTYISDVKEKATEDILSYDDSLSHMCIEGRDGDGNDYEYFNFTIEQSFESTLNLIEQFLSNGGQPTVLKD